MREADLQAMHSSLIPKYSRIGESIPTRENARASSPRTPRYYSSAVEGYLNINPDSFSQTEQCLDISTRNIAGNKSASTDEGFYPKNIFRAPKSENLSAPRRKLNTKTGCLERTKLVKNSLRRFQTTEEVGFNRQAFLMLEGHCD